MLFLAGLVLTLIFANVPSTRQLIVDLGRSGVGGALISGLLYAFAFTSSLATIIFLHAPESSSSVVLAIVGGLGAALYDIVVYGVIKSESKHGFLVRISSVVSKRPLPTWLSLIIGITILGSPLPDELAAGFFGFLRLSARQFVGLSLFANIVGLFIILSIR